MSTAAVACFDRTLVLYRSISRNRYTNRYTPPHRPSTVAGDLLSHEPAHAGDRVAPDEAPKV